MCAKVLHNWNGSRKFLSSLSCCSHFSSELSISTSAAVAWRPLHPAGWWCEVTFSAPFHPVWCFYCLKPILCSVRHSHTEKSPCEPSETEKLRNSKHISIYRILFYCTSPNVVLQGNWNKSAMTLPQESERTWIMNRESIIADNHCDTDIGQTQNIGKPLWDDCLWILELLWSRETFPDKQIPPCPVSCHHPEPGITMGSK